MNYKYRVAILIVLFVFIGGLMGYYSFNEPENQNNSQVNYCTLDSRIGEYCIQEYSPVCGWFNEEIKCLRYPCAKEYTNSCFACLDENVEYWTSGNCPN